MAEMYRVIFTCPKYDEREVWYVSSRKQAEVMLSRQVRTPGSSQIQVKYREAEYDMTVEPMFVSDGDAMYTDPRGIG